MSALLMISPAPVIETPGREVILDVDFVEGMKLHCQFWPGRVCCVLRRGATQIPQGLRFSPRRLGFDLVLLDPDEPVPDLLFEEAVLVYCAADDMSNLHLPELMRGRIARLVYTIERSPGARFGALLSDRGRSAGRKMRSALWLLHKEIALRAALKGADGVHCNGYPAHEAYRRLHSNSLMYLENRVRTPMLARSNDQQARAERLRAQGPLRLVYFGPLEAPSGVLDLLQTAFLLKSGGVDFRLEIFGAGSLAERLHAGIAALGLHDLVSLAGNPGFDAVLVPHLRREADLLVVPQRTSDPHSIYVEAMGCGVPVLAYANAMWRKLHEQSGGGWRCRSGSVAGLTGTLARLDANREAIVMASGKALEFARATTFENVFARRMAHLRTVGRLD